MCFSRHITVIGPLDPCRDTSDAPYRLSVSVSSGVGTLVDLHYDTFLVFRIRPRVTEVRVRWSDIGR